MIFGDRICKVSVHVLHDSCLIFIVTVGRWWMKAVTVWWDWERLYKGEYLSGILEEIGRGLPHRGWPFWETDQEDGCSISVFHIAQAFGTTWVFTLRSVDLHGWAWGRKFLNPLNCLGNVFICIVSGLW